MSLKDSVSSSVTAVVAVLTLSGVGIGMYADLKSDLAVSNEKYIQLKEEAKALDQYDTFLQRQLEAQKDKLLKTEARQGGIEKTQARLERTMEDVLKELKIMNENLIRLEPK